MSFICNLEHSVLVSFDSVRINILFFLPELEFIFNLENYKKYTSLLHTITIHASGISESKTIKRLTGHSRFIFKIWQTLIPRQ